MLIRSIIIILAFLFNFTDAVFGQNLIPNAGFENAKFLPCSWTVDPSDFGPYFDDWELATGGTVDLYSTLTDTNCIMSCGSKKSRVSGYAAKFPRSGNNMAGMITYSNLLKYNPDNPDIREYLEIKLATPLVVGETYYAEMFVLASANAEYFCNNLGMYFSDTYIKMGSTTGALNLKPQIIEKQIIKDTLNWVKISGKFVAGTPAEYVIIGNFYDNKNTSFIEDTSRLFFYGYYFIDDVTVFESEPDRYLVIDTSICPDETLVLTAEMDSFTGWTSDSITYNVFSTDKTIQISPANDEYFIAFSALDTIVYRVTLKPEAPTVDLGADSMFLCEGEHIQLNASYPDAEYLWQDGSTNPNFTVIEPGTYWVTLSNPCGSGSDTVTITQKYCQCHLFVPNVFTPNMDSFNESFGPVINCTVEKYQLQIYNRWGERLFESHDYYHKWDGYYRNRIVPEGVYFWILHYKEEETNANHYASGTVTLLR